MSEQPPGASCCKCDFYTSSVTAMFVTHSQVFSTISFISVDLIVSLLGMISPPADPALSRFPTDLPLDLLYVPYPSMSPHHSHS